MWKGRRLWLGGRSGLFFKTDADRGFYQIVCATDSESLNNTCFEMFHRLWVSSRMLFGQKNGPATFKRNAVIMQEELLEQGKTKSYFDDIIGKAVTGDFRTLRETWVWLLQLTEKHGWKFKPAKTKWGFRTIETVRFKWSPNGVDIKISVLFRTSCSLGLSLSFVDSWVFSGADCGVCMENEATNVLR